MEELGVKMRKMRADPNVTRKERKAFFMQECLKWHPDKNKGKEEESKEVFQFLQEKKAWFLGQELVE